MAGRGPGEIPQFDAASAALVMVEVIEHGYEVDVAPLGGVAPASDPNNETRATPASASKSAARLEAERIGHSSRRISQGVERGRGLSGP